MMCFGSQVVFASWIDISIGTKRSLLYKSANSVTELYKFCYANKHEGYDIATELLGEVPFFDERV
jgi:hypothetical protein